MFSAGSGHPGREVLADADRIGHRGEGRVHGSDAREEARVDDVQVVDLVGLAVDVQYGSGGVGAEPAGADWWAQPATGTSMLR
jgi:hypothetical protein